MNLYKIYLDKIKDKLLKHKNTININSLKDLNSIVIENPPEKFDYDFSSNAAMVLAKRLKDNPKNIAEKIKNILNDELNDFSSINIAGPGFLNFKLTKNSWINIIEKIIKTKKNFGSNDDKKKYNIEFVSANPTGPMHVGHCRGAIFGDVLSNLLIFNGNKVTKEFYINDYGSQINDFAESVYFRLRELKLNENFPNKKNLYPGEYIKNIAKKIILSKPKINLDNYIKISKFLKKKSINYSMDLIKYDLKQLGIKHDYFFSETKIVKENLVNKAINKLKKNKFVFEGFLDPPKGEASLEWKKEKRLIFKSTLFGDDLNRALKKNDGTWTYFANDIAYHSKKISRKFDNLINILGADHVGYIKRIKAAVTALSNSKVQLICKVCQLVKLYKNGSPFKMSKRLGDFITVGDLLKEVNKDSIRFMMLNRSNDVELDFDFNKVLEKNKENPVFYVQYTYARINSLFNSANLNLKSKINLNPDNFILNNFESRLLRKIVEWPRVVHLASSKFEPHRIPFYLYELATIFHSYWSKGNDDQKFKFIEDGKIKKTETLAIIILVAIVIQRGMSILGVSLPDKM